MKQSLIMLHGWSLDPSKEHKWQRFRDDLATQGVSSIFLKIPGLSAPLDKVWNLNDYAEWLEQKLADQKKVVLLGHSFGGQVAVRYAAQHPDKVEALILLDSSGIRDHALWPTFKRGAFLLLAKLGKIFFQHEFFRNMLYKLARERDYQQAPPLLRRTMSQILDDEVVKDLSKITAPTLLVWGKNDQVTPLKLARIFAQHIPHSQLQVVNDARHSPQYTHSAEVAQIVHQFLTAQGM